MSDLSATGPDLRSATRLLDPELLRRLRGMKAGQRIRITQRVRVGSTATWQARVEGTFRSINYLATGLATERKPEDDIVVITVHFTKDNGELSSVTLDENSQIELVSQEAVDRPSS
jgi:hypothetical protein